MLGEVIKEPTLNHQFFLLILSGNSPSFLKKFQNLKINDYLILIFFQKPGI